MTLRRVGVWSAARVLGALYGALGLLFGAIVSAVAILGTVVGSGGSEGLGRFGGLIFGVGAIVALPLFYGLLGLVGGAITAGLYNLFAGLVGGLEVEFDQGP